MRRFHRWPLFLVSLLALIAFAVGVTFLDAQSMWRDEVDAIRFASVPWPEMAANFTRAGWNGPLYFLLLRGWIAVSGASAYAVRFLSLFFGVLCVPLVFALGRRLFDCPTAIVAALLMASAPYLGWYSVEAKMYTWNTALALLAIYALRRAFEGSGWWWWAVQIVATTLAAYSHILAALLIPVQAGMYVVWGPRTRRQWIGGLASAVCLTLPYLPLLRWQAPLLFQSRATGFAPTSLAQIAWILPIAWSVGPYPAREWLTLIPKVLVGLAVAGLAFVALIPLARRPDEPERPGSVRAGLSLIIWVALPALVVGVISLWQPIFTDRYLIWSAPAFYLLVGLGLSSIIGLWDRTRAVIVVVAVVFLTSNLASAYLQLATPTKADFRAAAGFVSSYRAENFQDIVDVPRDGLSVRSYLPLVISGDAPEVAAGDLFVFQIPHARHAFDYYYPESAYAYADGPYTNHLAADGSYLTTEEQMAPTMAQITAGYDTVWLIATEVEMWDERQLTLRWLDTHMLLELVAHFPHIDVYRYARRPTR